jgi:Zn-dependent protease with chaperone function
MGAVAGSDTCMELVYKHEKKLFVIALIISLLVWGALIFATLGLALIYVPIAFLFYLFAQSAFISYIKGTAVKVSETQYPDLHQRLLDCCRAVGQEKIPDCYVLRADTFNALATKFLGRNYIVLFSDVIDALESKPDALNFYIGHELGHIHRKHLTWSAVLIPAKLLPLLGAAYSRACESTCDRYGFACCSQAPDAAIAGLMAIGATNSRYLTTNVRAYADQSEESSGFWMSLHELTGGYPWLVKRVAAVEALSQGREAEHPRRNPGAWFLAAFIPNIGIGGAGVLVIVAMLGIIAAVALPAYQQYRQISQLESIFDSADEARDQADYPYDAEEEATDGLSVEEARAQVDAALLEAEPFKAAVAAYAASKKALPQSGDELGDALPAQQSNSELFTLSIGSQGEVIAYFNDTSLGGATLVLEPVLEEGELTWSCYSPEFSDEVLPDDCK